ncbi:putative Na+-dependent transporter [Bradyrhizobium sp. USDA 3686]|uniref:bile acid:sodium symporter n=1 Tax=Bradyrhizobium canariense TaxID=255045 RepID=UPI0019566020|nr:bile acid:sodium symporter [Bradyrhizobium canariense]MBM7487874.1 putative Na+-dependent transporter [Bradyrhizobium canariense]
MTALVTTLHRLRPDSFTAGIPAALLLGLLGAAAEDGLWARGSVGDLIVVGVLSGMLLAVATIWGARRLGFSLVDEIAIAFCGSKKSLAPAVPIAGALVPAAAVGGVILPLAVFHRIQLAVCAGLARHYVARAANIPGEDAP